MPLVSEDLIRRLASFKSQNAPVISFYLDVDGRRYPKYTECEIRADKMVKRATDAADSNGAAVADADMQRIEATVKGGLDRSHIRGLAIFSCAAEGLWEVLELPVPVRDQVIVNRAPHVRPLETVADESRTFGLLIADKQRARMFVFELGQLVDKSEMFDALPYHDDTLGHGDRGGQRHTFEAAVHQHLKRAAQVAFEAYKDHPFDHLIIGAPEEIASELERDLHTYLRERIAARISVPTSASEAVIRAAALEVEDEVERRRRAELVRRIRELSGGKNGAEVGLERVLDALAERRVDTLVVSEGFTAEGWRCPNCARLATRGRTCRVCGSSMEHLSDVVEDAVQEAIGQHCKVTVCTDDPDLDVIGQIAALLRF